VDWVWGTWRFMRVDSVLPAYPGWLQFLHDRLEIEDRRSLTRHSRLTERA